MLDKLEKRLGWIGIPNLTYILIIGQVLSFILIYFNPKYEYLFQLNASRIFEGEYFRAIFYLFHPLSMDIIFAAFTWYIYYLYGVVLENKWGAFRYTLYILIAYIGTLLVSFIFSYQTFGNGYIYTSLFLAFAYLYPDFQLYIFFILPIKVKWLAYLAWIGILGTIIVGSFGTKVIAGVSIVNFLLFFGTDILYSFRGRMKGVMETSVKVLDHRKPNHICTVCGRNEVDDPDMDIFYCSDCVPSLCYCEQHIHNHAHKREPIVNNQSQPLTSSFNN